MTPDRDVLTRLMPRIAAGDTAAFTRFYDLLAPGVYGVAFGVTADPRLAQRATADAFAEMWRTASRCTSTRAITADEVVVWAMAITVRRAEDAPVRTGDNGNASPVTTPLTTRQDPDGALPAAISRMLHGLWRLPDEHRCAILLAVYGRLTPGQIARILTTSSAEIAVNLRDGLASLRSRSPDREPSHA